MSLTFRTVAIVFVVMGIAIGISFGAGTAFGKRGKAPAAAGGLTSAQILQLVGGSAGGGGGAAAAAGGATGGTGTQNQAGGLAALLGGATVGRVTAVQGQTVTVQTSQGASIKINLTNGTSVNKVATGAPADIAMGAVIVANGTKKDDGSVDATSVSQVPPELATLAGNGTATRPATTPAAAPATTPGAR